MDSGQPSSPELFLNVPFSRRWECHRNTIHRLYIDEDRPVEGAEGVAAIMKGTYRFDANVRQYKSHLKKWNISKSVSSTVKDQAIQTLGKRIRDGTAVGGIRYKGVEIDKQKLRRYIQDDARLNANFKLTHSVFFRWNLPYRALKVTLDHPSPGASDFSTPSNFSVFSPPVIRDHPTPGNAASPVNAPTPTTQAISVKTHFDRSRSFIQGDIGEFLGGMSSSDRRVATTWLHQFWLFAFTTSKHWGKGPKKWTADMLRMTEFPEQYSLPSTPAGSGVTSEARSPSSGSRNQYGVRNADHQQHRVPQPSPLCRWCIHVNRLDYEDIPSPPLEEGAHFDVQDSNNWPQWAENPFTVVERLRDALEDNSFSNMNTQDLPLSTNAIAMAAAASPDTMNVEAIGFAIMAQNVELVDELLNDAVYGDLDISAIYPYHLAASYLNGSSTCCDMFVTLLSLVRHNVIGRLYVNELGHTVLDSFMLTILKAHTSCTPIMADERVKTMTRFPGEEIDICGRWDADSPCLRALNAHGPPGIPLSWKHMFCHTSVQAICHSIARLFSAHHSPDINTPSGLFTKSCFTCGDRLVPGPLHTLVLTAFNLAQNGCEGETLFGMVACLTCLLMNGADPTAKANLSVDLLLEVDRQHECSHVLLDPLELGEKVPPAAWNSWPEETRLGWDCFMAVLGFAQREMTRVTTQALRSGQEADDYYFDYDAFPPLAEDRSLPVDGYGLDSEDPYDVDDDRECDHRRGNMFCVTNKHLGVLWSAIQTELVSYRRIQDGDPWISNNFDLRTVKDGANTNAGFARLPLLNRRMMKPVCRCGKLFTESEGFNVATTDEACSFYFSNMEDWSRSTYRTFVF
ncbi:hypothetical protein ANO14919_017250 [Xylariales sp. No.14919]|nr:hypothetical protein ANO14919_017250 [Xylariales sp. No.14919]